MWEWFLECVCVGITTFSLKSKLFYMTDRKTEFSALMADEIIFLVYVKAAIPNKNKEIKSPQKTKESLRSIPQRLRVTVFYVHWHFLRRSNSISSFMCFLASHKQSLFQKFRTWKTPFWLLADSLKEPLCSIITPDLLNSAEVPLLDWKSWKIIVLVYTGPQCSQRYSSHLSCPCKLSSFWLAALRT